MSFKDNHNLVEMRIEVERDITPGLPAVDRAIAFVRKRGKATSSELHMVMDLSANELPSDHLDDALQQNRLVKDGKHWTLGVMAEVALAVENEIADAESIATDRELLHLAAKAVGWELVWGPYDKPEPGEKSIEFNVRRKGIYDNWNPLHSRNDADLLAAVLGLNEKMGRRDIVRAAAEIGRAA